MILSNSPRSLSSPGSTPKNCTQQSLYFVFLFITLYYSTLYDRTSRFFFSFFRTTMQLLFHYETQFPKLSPSNGFMHLFTNKTSTHISIIGRQKRNKYLNYNPRPPLQNLPPSFLSRCRVFGKKKGELIDC